MTLSLADRCSKTQKIRILPMAGRDPESHRNEMIKVTHPLLPPVWEWLCSRRNQTRGVRPVADRHCAQLHKDLTWRPYIMGSHSGQWNGKSVSMSGGGWFCIYCQHQTNTADSFVYSFTVLSAHLGKNHCTSIAHLLLLLLGATTKKHVSHARFCWSWGRLERVRAAPVWKEWLNAPIAVWIDMAAVQMHLQLISVPLIV